MAYWIVVKRSGRIGLAQEPLATDGRIVVQFGASGPYRHYKGSSLRAALPDEIKQTGYDQINIGQVN